MTAINECKTNNSMEAKTNKDTVNNLKEIKYNLFSLDVNKTILFPIWRSLLVNLNKL